MTRPSRSRVAYGRRVCSIERSLGRQAVLKAERLEDERE
jgi:hypothetical protein